MDNFNLKKYLAENKLNEAEGTDLYYDAGQMISQVGLFTRENADKIDAEGDLLGRWYDTPEEREELIKISEGYKDYLAKVKEAFDTLMNDPMYRVAVGDVGGKYRDRGPGETLEKAFYRANRY